MMSIRAGVLLFIACPLLGSGTAGAQGADVELWRLDCGEFIDFPIEKWSDTWAYPGKTGPLASSCYLVRHGQAYMLWDTGLSAATVELFGRGGYKTRVRETIEDQLARISVAPSQITILGISHHGGDHVGQASRFAHARLLMGRQDFEALVQSGSDALAPWTTAPDKLERIAGDKDVFGDGSVVMLATPGHTLGHHSLLVRLPRTGPVILAGDLWLFAEDVRHSGVPPLGLGTMDRAAALASMDRITKAAANLRARIIIQHEPADIAKLPAFPASAR